MTELTDLDEASLAAHAAEWRRRALRGEKKARGIAHALEAEMRRRSGDTIAPQNTDDLDTRPLALRQGAAAMVEVLVSLRSGPRSAATPS